MKYTIWFENDLVFQGSIEIEAEDLHDLVRKLERGDVVDEDETTIYESEVTEIDVIKE